MQDDFAGHAKSGCKIVSFFCFPNTPDFPLNCITTKIIDFNQLFRAGGSVAKLPAKITPLLQGYILKCSGYIGCP